MHAWRLDDLLVLVTVGREGDATVEEHFQIWPHLVEGLGPRQLQHSHENAHHPRRHAAEVGDILMQCLAGNLLALLFEVAHQGRLFRRHALQVGYRGDVLDENSTQVAHQRVCNIIVWLVATAENQCLAIEHAALRIVLKIVCHSILASAVVDVLQTFTRHGDELRFVVRGSTRLCKPRHQSWPQHISLAVAHAVYPGSQFLVGCLRDEFCKFFIGMYVREVILPTILGVSALSQ